MMTAQQVVEWIETFTDERVALTIWRDGNAVATWHVLLSETADSEQVFDSADGDTLAAALTVLIVNTVREQQDVRRERRRS